MAVDRVTEFQEKKRAKAREDTNKKMDKERHEIRDYEMEASQLEMLEADLLKKLQET